MENFKTLSLKKLPCLQRSALELPRMRKAVYKSGTGTSGRVCGDLGLGDARRGTWGRQVWDAGTSKTRTQGTRDVNDYCKSRR